MISIRDALSAILADVPKGPDERVRLDRSRGRVLAADVVSPLDLPHADQSAMDGFAVRADDAVDGAALRVVGTVAAGAVAVRPVGPGEAMAIMTGGWVPDGADAVVMVEHVDRPTDERVVVRRTARRGDAIRRRGEDVAAGAIVIRAGETVDPSRMGALAAIGGRAVTCVARPRIGVLSTGDEVRPLGARLKPGQLWNSNGPALAAAIREAGGLPVNLGIAPDDLALTVAAVRRGLSFDALVTTGGVSVGAYDVVKEAQRELGIAMNFWRVDMKPGKPLAFGVVPHEGRRVPWFGLPGNPVSALVNFVQFTSPWIRSWLGDPLPYRPVVRAQLRADLVDAAGRPKLLRVRLEATSEGLFAWPASTQSSGAIGAMAACNALALVPGPVARVPKGEWVVVQPLTGEPRGASAPGYPW